MTEVNQFGPQQSEPEISGPEAPTVEGDFAGGPIEASPAVLSPNGELSELIRSATVNVANLDRSIVVVAGGAVGHVSMDSRQPLPVTDIPELELKAVELAWVGQGPHDEHLPTAAEAERLLRAAGPALTVIAGAPGLGKRSIGLRTGWLVAHDPPTTDGKPLQMKEIRPDWEKPEAPDVSLLPRKSGVVYLLDVASEIDGWADSVSTASALIKHAEDLRRSGAGRGVRVD